MTCAIRPAEPTDLGFLEDMLYEAATWRGEDADRATVLKNPHLTIYLSDWGREGDTALIATNGGDDALGAAWFRFFSADNPGYGFVDETVPEISMAVAQPWRGRGVGTRLMSALVATAQRQGIHALSLSVEPDNPARRLYEGFGVRIVFEDDGAFTMRLDLTSTQAQKDPRF